MFKKVNSGISYFALAISCILLGIIISVKLDFTSLLKADNEVNTPIKVSEEMLSLQKAFTDIAEKVGPAVVWIGTEQTIKSKNYGNDFDDLFRRFFGDENPRKQPQQKEYKQRGLGTGIIISEDGYIITNYHVVKDVTKITVTLSTKDKYSGKVIGADKRNDVAVVKIDSKKKLPIAVLGDSDKVKVGEWVVAIGNPFGYDHTVTAGVVSAKGRMFFGEDEEGVQNRMPNLIQTDAAINPGNSGGPLVNILGEVIGINVAIYSPSGAYAGIGFAVPINSAKNVLGDLMKGKKFVSATPWIGVRLQELEENLSKKFKVSSGVLIAGVDETGPGKKAGLKAGDIVIKIDSKTINAPDELAQSVAEHRVGDKIKLTIIRSGKEQIIEVILAPWGKAEVEEEEEEKESSEDAEIASEKWLGMEVATITSDIAEKYQILTKTGVIITNVKEDSIAYENELQQGDVIKEIDNEPIKSISDFKKAVKKAKSKDGALLLIERDKSSFYVVLTEK